MLYYASNHLIQYEINIRVNKSRMQRERFRFVLRFSMFQIIVILKFNIHAITFPSTHQTCIASCTGTFETSVFFVGTNTSILAGRNFTW